MTLQSIDENYYIEKARQCFILADLCHDQQREIRIREIARKFLTVAIALGANKSGFPADWYRHQNRC